MFLHESTKVDVKSSMININNNAVIKIIKTLNIFEVNVIAYTFWESIICRLFLITIWALYLII
jgi:hypothetical protein